MKNNTLEDFRDGKIPTYDSSSIDKACAIAKSPEWHGRAPNSKARRVAKKSCDKGELHYQLSIKAQADIRLTVMIETAKRLEIKSSSLSSINQDHKAYKARKAKFEEAELDYNYCKFYPATEMFRSLDRSKGIGQGPETEQAVLIRGLIMQCIQDGSLASHKDARLDDVVSKKLFTWSVGPKKWLKLPSVRSPVSQHLTHQANSGPTTSVNVDRSEINDTGFEEATVVDATPPSPVVAEHGTDSPEAEKEVSSVGGSSHPSEPPSDDETISENDESNSENDEMMINLQSHGDPSSLSEGEIVDSQGESEAMNFSGSLCLNDDDSKSRQELVSSTDGSGESRSQARSVLNARVLRDLDPQDLNVQLKYFHVTKTATDVDPSMPVQCLVCAQAGHMADTCDVLTCSSCGAYNQHTTQLCPRRAKCSKCREQGHGWSECQYKLKHITLDEIICNLCQRTGHNEGDCELVWRTSGRPWDFDLSNMRLRLSCYECGRSGHLGNDCRSRRPGKQLGSSTWGSGKGQISIKSKGQITIKGRASQQQPIVLSDSDDEIANFHRSKAQKPAQKRQIKIKAAPSSYNQSYRPDNHRNAGSNYNNAGDERLGRYTVQDNHGSGYVRDARRSVSPSYRAQDRDYRSDRYPYSHQPPPHHSGYQSQRPPAANAMMYRPMPSSGPKAWSRHRT